ncbi:hypothetical protein GBA52_021567 [Prunus armeniaca]|nr:hypothetical protein GBA52_021567 [Prunus armeniaca]
MTSSFWSLSFAVRSQPSVRNSIWVFIFNLGMTEEVLVAVREMGIEVSTEIQCIEIPAVLDQVGE